MLEILRVSSSKPAALNDDDDVYKTQGVTRYTSFKIVCDEMNRNIAAQFVTQHLLAHQLFYKFSIWLSLDMHQTTRKVS
jgi:hypothetical protein